MSTRRWQVSRGAKRREWLPEGESDVHKSPEVGAGGGGCWLLVEALRSPGV